MQVAQLVAEHTAWGPTMQVAYARGMDEPRPYRDYRRRHLSALIRRFGGPKALAAKLGATPDTHLIAIEQGRRQIGDDLASKLEDVAGMERGELDRRPVDVDSERSPLQIAIEALARHMAAADEMTREAAAPLLGRIAKSPGEAGTISRTLHALLGASYASAGSSATVRPNPLLPKTTADDTPAPAVVEAPENEPTRGALKGGGIAGIKRRMNYGRAASAKEPDAGSKK